MTGNLSDPSPSVAMLREEPKMESAPELPLERSGATTRRYKPKKSKKCKRNDTCSECPKDDTAGPRGHKVAKKKAAKKGVTVKVLKKRVQKKAGSVTANLKAKMKMKYGKHDESSSYSSDSGTSCYDSHSTDCSTCPSCSCSDCCSTNSSSSSSSSPEPRRQRKPTSQRKSRR